MGQKGAGRAGSKGGKGREEKGYEAPQMKFLAMPLPTLF